MQPRPPRSRPSTIYLLHQSSQALRSRLEHGLRPLGVTGLQYTILALLERHRGLSSAELSRRFFVTPQTMNQIVAGLTRRGLVARCPSVANKRILQMTLTDAGRDLLGACEGVCDRVEAEAMASVAPDDLLKIRENLGALLRQLRQAARDQSTPAPLIAMAGAEASASPARGAPGAGEPAAREGRSSGLRKVSGARKKPVPSR